MQITSADIQHEGKIPASFTCDGENSSPELSWRDAPAETKSFALIMHDPDAPRPGGFTHWAIYNIPASVAALEPNIPSQGQVPGTGIQGKNDSGRLGYMGPCPPAGIHRYYFRLYALDTELDLAPGASPAEVQEMMQRHILDQAELMGTYRRTGEKAA